MGTMDSINGQTDYQSSEYDQPPSNRRTRTAGPGYKNSVFTDPRVRALVAGYLEQQVSILLSNGPDTGNGEQFIAGQLDDVINELRSQS
jgi:hypothetical protein